MANFALIFLCLVAGIILRKSGRMPVAAPRAFNDFIIYLSLPAVILIQIPALLKTTNPGAELLVPISMAWLLFALSALAFTLLGKALRWSHAKTGALVLTAGLGNTSYVGFPVLDALLGAEGVRVGVLVDQLGTFLALSTFGIVAAAYFGGSRITLPILARRVFLFPPFISVLVASLWHLSGAPGRDRAIPVLERLSVTLVPLAMVSVGMQLRLNSGLLRRRWLELSCGLGFKLFAAPAFFVLLYVGLLGLRGLPVHVTLLESAMAPMITAAIVASEFDLDSELASLMVGLGIPLSLLSLPLWHWLLKGLL